MAAQQRPLSPFMIGPYYRPQLTSMTSISHRISGVLLSLAGFAAALWLLALAGDSAGYARFVALASSLPGKLLAALWLLCISYHLLNGLRHLGWDAGWGLDLKGAYATGWAVIAGTAVLGVTLIVLVVFGAR